MTVWPEASSRLIAAASPLETGIAPATNNVSAPAAAEKQDTASASAYLAFAALDVLFIGVAKPCSVPG